MSTLLPEDIINTVLMPFLVAPQNMKERLEIREVEDNLIKRVSWKKKTEWFWNNSKMIALSSASYTFENLYKNTKSGSSTFTVKKKKIHHFVSQLGYEALPQRWLTQQ